MYGLLLLAAAIETPGYIESMAKYADRQDMEFRGYVAEDDILSLPRRRYMTVLAYSSSAGSSGVAHLACEYDADCSTDLPNFVIWRPPRPRCANTKPATPID
jgi:hypothetical protein